MAEAPILNDLVNLQNETSAVTIINGNTAAIATAFEDVLSLSGTAPNQMQSPLDMNSEQILNLPAPLTGNSPARLQDLSTITGGGTVTNIPAGGTTNQVLSKTSNSNFAVGWATAGTGTATSVGLALPADLTVTNSPVTTSGTLTGAWTTTPTGTGAMVRATSPTLVTPALGTPSGVNLANASNLPLTAVTGNLPNSNLATMGAFTLKGNPVGSSSTPTDISIPSLTQKVSPAGTDIVLLADQAASGALKYATVSSIGSSSGVSSIAGNTGAFTLGSGLTNATNVLKNSGVVSLHKQTFTSSGTYTPTTGMIYCIIECVGSGAGGGGIVGPGTTSAQGSAGGGGGGYSKHLATATDIGSSQVVTIGAAGSAGAAGNNTGGNGAATSVGTICIANGGAGGPSGGLAQGGAGAGVGTGNLVAAPGYNGESGKYFAISSVNPFSGAGANSHYGQGGQPSLGNGSVVTGSAGSGYGAGGSGGSGQGISSASSSTGGSGTAGIVIITEFCNQ